MNPFLEAERARKRESLLAATEADLAKIAAACARARAPLRGQDKIAVRVDRVLNRRKVGKHFTIAITDDSFSYARNQDSITAEAALDGIYVLRTSVDADDLDSPDVVSSYKALAQVEWAFRAFNTDLDIRPIRHRTETGSARTCSCGCCRTTSPGTCTSGSRPSCSPTTTSPPPTPPGPARSPPPPAPEGPGQGGYQAHPGRCPGAQLQQPAHRSGHHLPEHHHPPTRPCPASARHYPDRRPAPRLRPARRQPPSWRRVVSSPAPDIKKAQVKRPSTQIAGGTSA